jgi:hypothetical protein
MNMKYNRALDYTALALQSLNKGEPVLAARLLAKAGEQKDLTAALQILELSNKTAMAQNVKAGTLKLKASALASKSRLKASEEDDMDLDDLPDDLPDADLEDEDAVIESDEMDDLECDPLDDIQVDEEEVVPAKAMARVLAKMVRR